MFDTRYLDSHRVAPLHPLGVLGGYPTIPAECWFNEFVEALFAD